MSRDRDAGSPVTFNTVEIDEWACLIPLPSPIWEVDSDCLHSPPTNLLQFSHHRLKATHFSSNPNFCVKTLIES